jgi:hypothetical protein
MRDASPAVALVLAYPQAPRSLSRRRADRRPRRAPANGARRPHGRALRHAPGENLSAQPSATWLDRRPKHCAANLSSRRDDRTALSFPTHDNDRAKAADSMPANLLRAAAEFCETGTPLPRRLLHSIRCRSIRLSTNATPQRDHSPTGMAAYNRSRSSRRTILAGVDPYLRARRARCEKT